MNRSTLLLRPNVKLRATCRGGAGAKIPIEYRAEPAYPHWPVNKETKKVEERTPESKVSCGRVGRRGERPDLDYPHRIGKNGIHGT
jgi:hypothetical protein